MNKFPDIPVFADAEVVPVKFVDADPLPAAPMPMYADGTLADWIEKVIQERRQPGGRPIGSSQYYTLRTDQNSPHIGPKHHTEIKAADFLAHGKMRRAAGVKPQTIMHDMTFISGVIKYAMEIWEIETAEVAYKAYKKAVPQLKREQLIGKSQPRDRLPTDEEEAILRAFFSEQNERRTRIKGHIDMVLVMDGELKTGRRISELCRIERQHVNVAERTCWIYDLKNSKGKGYNAKFALIEGAWELFERRLAEIPNEPTARLFPFNEKSCGAKYTRAKNILKKQYPGLFQNLRMHDNRAECFVRLMEKGYSKEQVQKGVSLHKGDGKVLVDTYLRIKAEDLHRGPAALAVAA